MRNYIYVQYIYCTINRILLASFNISFLFFSFLLLFPPTIYSSLSGRQNAERPWLARSARACMRVRDLRCFNYNYWSAIPFRMLAAMFDYNERTCVTSSRYIASKFNRAVTAGLPFNVRGLSAATKIPAEMSGCWIIKAGNVEKCLRGACVRSSGRVKQRASRPRIFSATSILSEKRCLSRRQRSLFIKQRVAEAVTRWNRSEALLREKGNFDDPFAAQEKRRCPTVIYERILTDSRETALNCNWVYQRRSSSLSRCNQIMQTISIVPENDSVTGKATYPITREDFIFPMCFRTLQI